MPRDAEDWVGVVRALCEGDRLAFRKLSRLVTGFLTRSRAYDFRDEWDDVVQEVVLATARAVAEERLSKPSEVMGYVRNATRNRFVDWLRRRQLDSIDEIVEAGGGELAWITSGEPVAHEIALRDELAKLPEKQQLALVAVHVECRTYEEAAAAAGIPLGSLKRYLRDGLARLQERLEDG